MKWWPFRKRVSGPKLLDPFGSYVAILEVTVLPHTLHGAEGPRISRWPHYVLIRKDSGRQVELTEQTATRLLGMRPEPWMRYELEITLEGRTCTTVVRGTDRLKDPEAPPPPEPEVLTVD